MAQDIADCVIFGAEPASDLHNSMELILSLCRKQGISWHRLAKYTPALQIRPLE